jgi:hypothetical protein
MYFRRNELKNKHLFVFSIVTILLVATIFTGCGEKTSTTTSQTTSTTTTTTTTTTSTATTPTTEQPKYGGTVTQIQRASPGGNIGWPLEFAGGDATSSQMFYESLMRGLRDGTYEPMTAPLSTPKP